MKKAVGAVLLLGVLLAVLLVAHPADLPELANAEKTVAVTEDQTAYLAETKGGASWIYGVDDEGKVQNAYLQDAGYRVVLLSAYENDLYYVRTANDSSDSWQLIRLREGEESLLLESTRELPDPPDAISVSEAGIDLTFRAGSDLSVWRMELSGGEPAQLLDTELQAGLTAVSAVFADDKLFCLLSDGRILTIRAGGQEDASVQETGGFTLLSSSQGSVWAYRQENGMACAGASAVQSGSGVAVNGQAVLCGASGGSGGDTVVLSVENGKTVLVRTGGVSSSRVVPEVSLRVRLMFKTQLLLWGMVLYAVCALLFLLTLFLCRRTHRLAARITACCTCLFLFTAGIVSALQCGGQNRQAEELLTAQASAAGQTRASALEEMDLTSALAGTGSTDDALRQMTAVETAGGMQTLTYSSAILTVEGDAVRLSEYTAENSPVAAVYGAQAAGLAQDAAQGTAGTLICRHAGRLSAVDVRTLTRYGDSVGLLLTSVTLTQVERPELAGCIWPPFAAALLASAAVALLSFGMLRPLRSLTQRMRSISEGDFNLAPMRTASDEVGDMWQSLRETAVALRIKDYETAATVRSFYRFVPRGLEQLLGRASIMETSLGDMANVSGTVGILSIQNREDIRVSLDDNGFMGFLNESYSLIDRQMAANGGLLLSSGFNPDGLEFLFSGSPDQGVAFSVGLMGETGSMENGQAPDFFLLLHSASFLYGLVGTEQRTFSLLSSSEIAFLHTLPRFFRGTGVRMAATDACLKAMSKPCASRYIGFVSSEDGKYVYKLHQILEGCSDMEKSLCLSYDDKFQKGIRLFCENDFYLARNLFSAILKLNPGDGIARWYLFACEHYFNQNDPGSEGYNLFGIQE